MISGCRPGVERKCHVDGQVHQVEITRIAREVTGRALTANVVALGVLNRLCRLVSDEALVEAVLETVPRGTEAINRKSLEAGMAI